MTPEIWPGIECITAAPKRWKAGRWAVREWGKDYYIEFALLEELPALPLMFSWPPFFNFQGISKSPRSPSQSERLLLCPPSCELLNLRCPALDEQPQLHHHFSCTARLLVACQGLFVKWLVVRGMMLLRNREVLHSDSPFMACLGLLAAWTPLVPLDLLRHRVKQKAACIPAWTCCRVLSCSGTYSNWQPAISPINVLHLYSQMRHLLPPNARNPPSAPFLPVKRNCRVQ